MCRIGIVGATGVVGRTALKVLKERNLVNYTYFLYASKRSEGKKLKIGKRKVVVKELTDSIFDDKLDFALFCTNEKVSKIYVKPLSKHGTIVIDFSSLYRKKYPLIVPEINADAIKGRIICNPNCSTIAGVMALYKIHKKFGLKRVVYSTYQAVSGAGKEALDDLSKRRKKKLKCFKFPIFNNLIPYIGEISKNGYSKEENKMIYETKKILRDKKIAVTSTCVRVPIDVCHSESINFETRKKCGVKKIIKVLSKANGVTYQDTFPNYPMPLMVKGEDNVFVGRLRKDFSKENAFNMFVVSDNLKKGAAQNAVQILEILLERDKA